MTCLPVAGRELRVAARKRSSYWVRVAAAVTAVVIGCGCLFIGAAQGTRAPQMGSMLFQALTWLAFAGTLGAGLFFTSDCLSEEKREGTLGLLFLTELRGYDVALGKLLATSLRSFFALLALLPVLAITQLLGGVAGAQYGKAALALVNGLFFSLTAGLLVSALSRDAQKAISGTLLLLLLLTLGGPLADALIAGVSKRPFALLWTVTSPGYVLQAASVWRGSMFWPALITTQALAWVMLGLASALVPRTWQGSPGRSSSRGWAYAWKYGRARSRQRLRHKLLVAHPLAWLNAREIWQARTLWVVSLIMLGGFIFLLTRKVPREAWIVWNYFGGLFLLLLYLWTASQACRFLVEARRSGLLELLLVSPVTERLIVAGQWRALLRRFGLPLLLLLGVNVAASMLSQLSFQRMAAQTSSMAAAAMTNQVAMSTNPGIVMRTNVIVSITNYGTIQSGASPSPNREEVALALLAVSAGTLSTVGNLVALAWFGMWMGMTSRSANLATLKTILFVQIIPWFLITFVTSFGLSMIMAGVFLRGSSGPSLGWFTWWPLVSAGVGAALSLGKDIGFILWARNRLYTSLRDRAAAGPALVPFISMPPRPPTPAPPVIPGTA